MQQVKVRFAPSPTGFLHIGGARTALFNWLYARHTNGKFVLRIEDTDKERSKQEYIDEILDSMKWLGMDWDEGPVFQTQRSEIYLEFAQKLLDEGKAYKAKERRNKGASTGASPNRPSTEGQGDAIIFEAPDKEITFTDLIRGGITFSSRQLGDQIIVKSNGLPTYNFACVVDDALSGITHILRGDDHISNTPKQVMLYEALGFDLPLFAHFPLIMGKGGGRLSKRTGATAISEFRSMGYLPEALLNYLLLLSWSPGNNQEIISIQEAIEKFDIKDVNKTSAVFDIDKLNWINAHYIREKSSEELVGLLKEFFKEKSWDVDEAYAASAVNLFKERVNTLRDFVEWADYFFTDDYEKEESAIKKHLSKDMSELFSQLVEVFENISDWNPDVIERDFRALVDKLGIKAKELIHPTRAALSGKKVGPGLFELIAVLGKERTIARLKNYITQ